MQALSVGTAKQVLMNLKPTMEEHILMGWRRGEAQVRGKEERGEDGPKGG